MSDDTAKIARDAAVQSLAANGVYFLLVIGLAVLMTRRDWLARQAMRVQRAVNHDLRKLRTAREVADFRREVSDWEHRED